MQIILTEQEYDDLKADAERYRGMECGKAITLEQLYKIGREVQHLTTSFRGSELSAIANMILFAAREIGEEDEGRRLVKEWR